MKLSQNKIKLLDKYLFDKYGKISDELTHEDRVSLAEDEASEIVLEWLSFDNDDEIRKTVIENKFVTSDVLSGMVDDESPAVVRILADNDKLNHELLKRIYEKHNGDDLIMEAVGRSSWADGDMLTELSNHSEFRVRCSVANNVNTPKEILDKLSNDVEYWVRAYTAYNLNAYPGLLEQLSSDTSVSVKEGVARNPSTPTAVLTRLSKDVEVKIRACVAANPNTPISVLDELTSDGSPTVRGGVAFNKSATRAILSKLLRDPDYWVRAQVGFNKSADDDIRKKGASFMKKINEEPQKETARRPRKDFAVLETGNAVLLN